MWDKDKKVVKKTLIEAAEKVNIRSSLQLQKRSRITPQKRSIARDYGKGERHGVDQSMQSW